MWTEIRLAGLNADDWIVALLIICALGHGVFGTSDAKAIFVTSSVGGILFADTANEGTSAVPTPRQIWKEIIWLQGINNGSVT